MLTTTQRKVLENAIATEEDKQIKKRMKIVLLRSQGRTLSEICRELKTSNRIISHWVKNGNPDNLDSFKGRELWRTKHKNCLTKEQEKKLEDAISKTSDYRIKTRASIFLWANKGLSYNQIAIELGITYAVVRYWLEKGNPDDLKSLNNLAKSRVYKKPKKLNSEAEKYLLSLAAENPLNKGSDEKRWKLRELSEELRHKMGVDVPPTHIASVLKRKSISLNRYEFNTRSR